MENMNLTSLEGNPQDILEIRNRVFRCSQCGHEQVAQTNHKGSHHSVGRHNVCPKCPPFRKYPEYGRYTKWEYVRED